MFGLDQSGIKRFDFVGGYDYFDVIVVIEIIKLVEKFQYSFLDFMFII